MFHMLWPFMGFYLLALKKFGYFAQNKPFFIVPKRSTGGIQQLKIIVACKWRCHVNMRAAATVKGHEQGLRRVIEIEFAL